MCAMFQQPIRPAGDVHVEFRAGLCEYDGRIVTADKRKGKMVLVTSSEDQLLHVQWYDREKNEQPKLDQIVIADAYLEKIDACKTGRVYLLRSTSHDLKRFFWMQEPKAEGDAELIKKFNEKIGCPIPEKSGSGATSGSRGAALPSSAELAAAMTGQGGQQPVDPQLAAALRQFLQAQQRTPPVPLTSVLTTEVLLSLMDDEAAVSELVDLLPEGQRTAEDLRESLSSAQLQQSLAGLTQAVHSDQLPILFASLGLDPGSVTPGSDGLEVLCRALETQQGGSGQGGGAPPASG